MFYFPLFSSPLIEVDNSQKHGIQLSQDQYFIDKDKYYNIENVLLSTNIHWKNYEKKSLNLGPIEYPVWIKFKLINNINEDKNYFLKYDFPSIDFIDIYELNDKSIIINHIRSGDHYPFSFKPLPSHTFIFPIKFKPSEIKTIIIKSETSAIMSIPITVVDYSTLYEIDTSIYLFFGIYFGLLGAIVIFSIITYAYIKKNSLLLYALYGVSNFLLVCVGYGFGFRYFYPNSLFIQNNIFLVAVGINGIFLILFCRGFLKSKLLYPKLDLILKIWIFLLFIWVIAFLLSKSQSAYYFISILAIIPILIVTTIGIIESKRNHYALYFVIAWFLFLLFYIISIMRLIGLIEITFISYYAYEIGSSLQMIFISLSMGHKTFEIRKERDILYKDYLQLKENSNRELIRLVDVKTSELDKKNKLIEADIEMAKNIQINTLSTTLNWNDDRISVSKLYLPKDKVSGDIYDLFKIDEDKYRFFIADATGHGIQAGFVTLSIQTEYQRIKSQYPNPADVIRLLNTSRYKTFGKEVLIYSCCIIDIDLDQNYLIYSSAGHPDQYLFQNGILTDINSTSPLIGFKPDLIANCKTIPLQNNFKLSLFSDGIIETRNHKNEFYGDDRLKDIIVKSADSNVDSLNKTIFDDLVEFSSNHPFDDDITSVIVDVKR